MYVHVATVYVAKILMILQGRFVSMRSDVTLKSHGAQENGCSVKCAHYVSS